MLQSNDGSNFIPDEEQHNDNAAGNMSPKIPYNLDKSIQLSTENNREMLRLIQQYLSDNGYPQVAQDLKNKSGVEMEDTSMQNFRACIKEGLFSEARDILRQRVPKAMVEVEYLLYEQEYLELLERGEKLNAILLLQRELTPRTQQHAKLYSLSQLILCETSEQLRTHAHWAGSQDQGRKALLGKLQTIMPVSEMLPPHRLENLVKQSIAFQTSQANCTYHNSSMSGDYSLLEDHNCARRVSIPSKCIGVLKKHKDEVWMVKFAPSGTRFASVGKDNVIFLWSLQKFVQKQSATSSSPQKTKYKVKCTHEIIGHSQQINSINWSPDEHFLISASHDSRAKIWDTKSGKLLAEIDRHVQQVTAAAFLSDMRILTSGVDKLMILWELRQTGDAYEVTEIARVETRNYLDIVVSASRFVAQGQNHFQVYNGTSLDNYYEHEINEAMTSIALSRDGRYLLANISLKAPRLELYELSEKKATLLRRFKGGHEQQMYVLRCAFGGGPQESFVLCGSEDASISLWNREKGGEVVAKLTGHAQVVNSVNWCPTDPLLFASTSDDMTIRLWGVESVSTCEIIEDSKDLKRIDIVKHQFNGKQSPMLGGAGAAEDEEIEEDEEEDEASEGEYDEEADDDDQEMVEEYNNAHARERVLQTTRVLRSSRREDDDEEDSRMDAAEDEEDDSDWVEGDQQH